MVLAHYGGIDEIGIFLVPAVAVFLLMRRAERNARARQRDEDEAKIPEDQT